MNKLMDRKYIKNRWMVEWIEKKLEKIAGWLDGQENRWMVGRI